MKPLTARQRQVLDTIRSFVAEKGYPPAIRELGPMLGISSLRGVTIHLDALEKKGWIQRESTSRSIRVLAPVANPTQSTPSRLVPLIGSISPGVPLLAVENVESHVGVPQHMAEWSSELFALKARGDSMIGDHIAHGDILLIRQQKTGDHGQIVAALVGDQATVKRLDMQSSPPRLLPSNPKYAPIDITGHTVVILGVVVGLVRSYSALDLSNQGS